MSIDETQEQRDDAQRAEVEKKNYDTLVERMERYGLTISAREFAKWRPTEMERGDISGVVEGVTIIATDGLLGFFVDDKGSVICGHIGWFSGDVKPQFSYHKDQPKRQPRRAKTAQEQCEELLTKLLNGER